jgi:hypothetical protein
MRRRCLGLIRPYLDETARGRLETWATCTFAVLSIHVATDTWRQMGSKTKFVGNVCLILRAPGSEGSLHERAMLARPLHCHCDAESTDRQAPNRFRS